MSLKQEISHILCEHLACAEVVLEIPKDATLGDLATPIAFSLAKEYKKSPMQIAEDLAVKLESLDCFESVVATKGFINFRISEALTNRYMDEILEQGFTKKASKNQKILLEFVSANPTGPLHIGHARGAIVGEALHSIGSFLGYEIDKEYYINDAGNQMDLLATSLIICYEQNILKQDVTLPEDYYRGEYLDEIAQEFHDLFGKEIFELGSKSKLASLAKDKVIELINEDLALIGVYFDTFVSEKSMYEKSEATFALLEKNKALYENEGKTWIASTTHKDEKDRVVIKEDKTPTYLAGDIIYHNDKFARGYDRYINIWGADHHGYINRVKSSIEFLGYDSAKLEIILSQMVALLKDKTPYKMSKRKGNFITLKEVAEEIGSEPLKLIFLSKKCDTHLEFDVTSLSKKDASNPIYYIQYAHTRICSLLRKSTTSEASYKASSFTSENTTLKKLIIQSLLLEDVLENAFSHREINRLIDYLHQLASEVHSFYNQNQIIDSPNEKLYLKTLSLVATTIQTALGLIGIEAKESM